MYVQVSLLVYSQPLLYNLDGNSEVMIITTNIQTPERGESVMADRWIHNYRKKEREWGRIKII